MNRFCFVFLLLISFVLMGNAQEHSGFEISLSSGYAFPSSPMTFANYWNMQYGGSVGGGMSLSPSLTLLGSVEYYRFTLDEEGVRDNFDTPYMRDIWIFNDVSMDPSAGPSSVLTVSANLRVAPSGMTGAVSPYVIAGGGVMFFTMSEIAFPTTSTLVIDRGSVAMTAEQWIVGAEETAGFLQVGIGLNIDISDVVNPFLEARYVFGFTKGATTSYIPVTGGVKIRI